MQNGRCTRDDECYSGVCWEQRFCSVDSRTPGKVGDNGNCHTNFNCYSSNCVNHVCAVQSAAITSLTCSYDTQCRGTQKCLNNYCQETNSITGAIVQSGLPTGSTCTYHSQCISQYCSGGYCSQITGSLTSGTGIGSITAGRYNPT